MYTVAFIIKTEDLVMQITSNFDSGNIRVIDASQASNIQLEIVKDNQSDFYQWFHLKSSRKLCKDTRFKITVNTFRYPFLIVTG